VAIGRIQRAIGAGLVAGVLTALTGAIAVAAPALMGDFVAGTPSIFQNEPAALSITVRPCPPGYDPLAEDADYARDCREPAGDTLFSLALAGSQASGPSASTGSSGDAPQESTVGFSELTPGRYTVGAAPPAEIESAFIGACTSDTRDFTDYPFVPFALVGPDGAAALTLEPGETLACDWYQIAGSVDQQ